MMFKVCSWCEDFPRFLLLCGLCHFGEPLIFSFGNDILIPGCKMLSAAHQQLQVQFFSSSFFPIKYSYKL